MGNKSALFTASIVALTFGLPFPGGLEARVAQHEPIFEISSYYTPPAVTQKIKGDYLLKIGEQQFNDGEYLAAFRHLNESFYIFSKYGNPQGDRSLASAYLHMSKIYYELAKTASANKSDRSVGNLRTAIEFAHWGILEYGKLLRNNTEKVEQDDHVIFFSASYVVLASAYSELNDTRNEIENLILLVKIYPVPVNVSLLVKKVSRLAGTENFDFEIARIKHLLGDDGSKEIIGKIKKEAPKEEKALPSGASK